MKSSYNTYTFGEDAWAEFFKLPEDITSYLWSKIDDAESNDINVRSKLAGNISKSLLLKDDKDIILSNILPSVNQSNIIKEVSKENKNCKVIPLLTDLWVNYQYKHEFNPLHWHSGTLSFVIWMKIPYDWEEEKTLPFIDNSGSIDKVGNFVFVWAENSKLESHVFYMNKKIEGHMCIFPSWLSHVVYPFYTSDEARISISGNISFHKTPTL